MNVACGMEMSITPKLCGAEVYACNVGKMKCWFGRGTKPTGTKWRRNGTHLPQAHVQSTRHILFSAQLMGGGESLRILHEVLNKNKLLKGA